MAKREDFGVRIDSLRTQSGLSGRALDALAGLQHGHALQIVRGLRKNISATTVAQIARVFGVSMDWLFLGDGRAPSRDALRLSVDRAKSRASQEV